MKPLFVIVFCALVAVGCSRSQSPAQAGAADTIARAQLLGLDLAFSDLSRTRGEQEAFRTYMADKGVFLRSDHDPIQAPMTSLFIRMMDTAKGSLTWQPSFADVAVSGDLGYTFGVYTYQGQDTVMQGTYVTVWKKDPAGSWKVVLDTGNPGLTKTK